MSCCTPTAARPGASANHSRPQPPPHTPTRSLSRRHPLPPPQYCAPHKHLRCDVRWHRERPAERPPPPLFVDVVAAFFFPLFRLLPGNHQRPVLEVHLRPHPVHTTNHPRPRPTATNKSPASHRRGTPAPRRGRCTCPSPRARPPRVQTCSPSRASPPPPPATVTETPGTKAQARRATPPSAARCSPPRAGTRWAVTALCRAFC